MGKIAAIRGGFFFKKFTTAQVVYINWGQFIVLLPEKSFLYPAPIQIM